MNDEIGFHLDEHIPTAIRNGLQRRNIDVTTTSGSGLGGAEDLAQLEFAARNGRVMVTFDDDYLQLHAAGFSHAGIAYCRQGTRSIGEILQTLILIYEVMSCEEMRNQVVYL